MSQHDPSIPTAILVPKKPRRRIKLPLFEGEIPWIKVAIFGSIAWVVVGLGVVAFFAMQSQTQRLDDVDLAARPVRHVAPDKPAVDAPKKVEIAAGEELGVLPLGGNEFVECARIGTNVRFMKEPAEAFQRAKDERKLVFIVHLSGNLEDPEFT